MLRIKLHGKTFRRELTSWLKIQGRVKNLNPKILRPFCLLEFYHHVPKEPTQFNMSCKSRMLLSKGKHNRLAKRNTNSLNGCKFLLENAKKEKRGLRRNVMHEHNALQPFSRMKTTKMTIWKIWQICTQQISLIRGRAKGPSKII